MLNSHIRDCRVMLTCPRWAACGLGPPATDQVSIVGTASGTTMDLAQPSNSVNGRLPSKTLRQQQRPQHQLATPLTSVGLADIFSSA